MVSGIIERYASEPNTLVLYFADHGEILYDDPSRPDYYGHGLIKQSVEVPLLIYLSPQMRAAYPELYNRIVRSKDRRIMLDLLTHALTGLLGVQTKYSDPRLDFFSDEYDEKRPRVIEDASQKLTL